MPRTYSIHLGGEIKPTGSVQLVMRNYFSIYLLWNALHMTSLAREIEARHNGKSRFDLAHRGYVVSAVLSSAAFLEAMVNELFQDALDEHNPTSGYLVPLVAGIRSRLAGAWASVDCGRAISVLDKYELLLVVSDRPALQHDQQPYQDVALLVKLRNVIAHYLPEGLPAATEHRLARNLKGKFPANALMAGSGNPWWPDHCLGAGCANWAGDTANALADLVSDSLGIAPPYQRVRDGGWMSQPP